MKLNFLFAIIFITTIAGAQATQTGVMLSPLHAEFGKHARGQFTLTNQGYATLSTQLEVASITIKDGKAVIESLSPTTHVKLSQYSAKIGAKQAHVFYYSITCDAYPCSVVIMSDIMQGHTDSGEAVTLRLGEIAYLCEHAAHCRDSVINAETGDLKAAK